MTDPWPVLYHENNRVPTSADPGQVGLDQWQSTTQPNTNFAAIQGCSCLWCSRAGLTARRTIEHQEPWPPGNAAFPYVNQSQRGDKAADVTASAPVNGQMQGPFIGPQPPLDQEGAGETSHHVPTGPLQVQTTTRLDEAQPFDMPVAESLRRLSERYVNHPESLVNAVRLEPSTSGRFRVTIMLEITDIH